MEQDQKCLNCPVRGDHILCSMDSGILEKFDLIGTPVRLRSGFALFREGDCCRAVHVLCSGRVKLSATSREGRNLILKIARSGEVLGLSAALAGEPHEVTAETVGPCQIKTIRRQTMLDFLDRNPGASLRAARCVAREYSAVFNEARRLALPATAKGRVANLLLEWSREYATNRRPGHSILPLTHEDIAAMTATSRETVTRALQQFKRDQLISIRGSSLTVLQPGILEEFAA